MRHEPFPRHTCPGPQLTCPPMNVQSSPAIFPSLPSRQMKSLACSSIQHVSLSAHLNGASVQLTEPPTPPSGLKSQLARPPRKRTVASIAARLFIFIRPPEVRSAKARNPSIVMELGRATRAILDEARRIAELDHVVTSHELHCVGERFGPEQRELRRARFTRF